MLRGLDHRFVKLEQQKQALLAELATYSPQQLSFRPDEQSWSPVGVLDHLHKTERAILDGLIQNLRAPCQPTLKDRAGSLFIIGLFLLPTRVRVPKTVTFVLPAVAVDKAQVEELWASTRKDLATLIGGFPSERASAGVFRHPVGGWMTMSQTLSFFSAHLTHHGYQLRRLRGAYERSGQAPPAR